MSPSCIWYLGVFNFRWDGRYFYYNCGREHNDHAFTREASPPERNLIFSIELPLLVSPPIFFKATYVEDWSVEYCGEEANGCAWD